MADPMQPGTVRPSRRRKRVGTQLRPSGGNARGSPPTARGASTATASASPRTFSFLGRWHSTLKSHGPPMVNSAGRFRRRAVCWSKDVGCSPDGSTEVEAGWNGCRQRWIRGAPVGRTAAPSPHSGRPPRRRRTYDRGVRGALECVPTCARRPVIKRRSPNGATDMVRRGRPAVPGFRLLGAGTTRVAMTTGQEDPAPEYPRRR